MKQDSMVYKYVWSVNVPKDGMGWEGCVFIPNKNI
jgi:hypothetical protein